CATTMPGAVVRSCRSDPLHEARPGWRARNRSAGAQRKPTPRVVSPLRKKKSLLVVPPTPSKNLRPFRIGHGQDQDRVGGPADVVLTTCRKCGSVSGWHQYQTY